MVVAATGFFDGVHIGHRVVISALCRIARERGARSMVVTFWPHPRTVLQQDAHRLRLLTSLEEKKQLLHGLGVDVVEVVEFTKEFSRLSAKDFLERYIRDKFGACALVLGYDHRLGGDVQMTREELDRTVAAAGLDVYRTDEFSFGEQSVSSTQIRNLLAAGDVEGAGKMLGYRYCLHGAVVSGNRLGRGLGFPTANMQLYEPLKLVPADGVYVVEAEVAGERYWGMTNIGVRPTVASRLERTIETNIFGFSSDIYGLEMKVRFVSRLRGEVHFPSMEALRGQLVVDRDAALEKIHYICREH